MDKEIIEKQEGQDPKSNFSKNWYIMFGDMSKIKDDGSIDICALATKFENLFIESELAALQSEKEETKEDFPEIDFRNDIANELTRDELIERLCDMHKSYTEMREEWFNVVHLGQISGTKQSIAADNKSQPKAETKGAETTHREEKILVLFYKYSNCYSDSRYISLPAMTRSAFIEAIKEYASQPLPSDRYEDTEADGYVFCGKCGKMK